ncbi:hypothetical protein AMAG_15841 [Allomyces macrogynus ATCC 38327]|uniref:Uncharacterized protein n=1 Tax=Allomyces macrogynus (strain ATCC 38327) TaxID=578462 RepID=A0A0L0T9F7_ALLM3|nr:hypothetical protein AMAG_15841 [Allomyces macrogynus ATCC 38327]|eukprot:KNE71179.1 hypothetical protein AMAG_15841 [Allomyces macrogynus ATCC 38327]
MATRISWNDIGTDAHGADPAAAPAPAFPGAADVGLRKRPAGVGAAGAAARILESRDLADMPTTLMIPPPPVSRARPAPHSVLSLSRVESALFRVAYAIAKEDDVPSRMWWVLRVPFARILDDEGRFCKTDAQMFLDDWQLLAFAFAPRLLTDMPAEVSYIVEPLRYVAAPYSNFVQINAFALAILFLTLALLAFAATRLLWGPGSVPPWPLKLLRVLLGVVQTALALPMLLVFFAGVRCVNNVAPEWNLSCTAAPHAPLVVLDAIALAMYLPLLVLGAAFLGTTSPRSTSPDARPHTRFDLLSTVSRILLVALFTFTSPTPFFPNPSQSTSDWWYLVLALAILAYLTSTLLHSLPYYTSGMTILRTALTTSAASALVGTMAATAVPTLSNAWLLVVLPCACAGLLAGTLASRRAHTALFDGAVRRWHAAAIADASHSGAGELRASASTAHADRVPGFPGSAVPANPAGPAGGDALLAADAAAAHSMLAQLIQGTSGKVLAVVRQRRGPPGKMKVFRVPGHVDPCLRVLLRGTPTPEQATLALHLLARGLREFDSPALLLDAARALGAWFDPAGSSAAAAILDDVRKRKLALDQKFQVYAHDRAAAEQAGAGGDGNGAVDALESAELRGVSRAATAAHLRSLHAARAVFESVRTGAPAPLVAAAIGTLALHRSTALRAYARLLAACPKSKTVLRGYAQFLMTVDGNAGKAAAVLEMVEEAEGGEHVGSGVLRETPAIVEEGGAEAVGENGGMGAFRGSFRPGNTAMSDQSDRVLRALRSLSKPAAAAAVTALDEEIEAFAELTEADSDEHDDNGPTASTAGIDATSAAGTTPADATGAGGTTGPGDGAGPRASPRTRMARKVVAAAVGVAVVTAVMFAFPLMCNGVDRDLQLIVQSNARQQQVQVTTLLVREMLAPEPLFADPANEIRAVRSALYDLARVHSALVVSSTRLAALLPALTVQPQPCPTTAPIPARCVTTVIGDTYVSSPVAYAPEIPLNQAVRTFIDAAGQLVTNSIPGAQLARPGLDPVVVNGVSVTPTLPNDGLLVLVQKIAQDIDLRVAALDEALREVVTAQLMQAMGGLVVAFVVAVVAAVVVAVAAATAGFRGLRDRAHTLAAVLHLVPPGVSKDAAGEVARLVETGGLALVAVGQEHE